MCLSSLPVCTSIIRTRKASRVPGYPVKLLVSSNYAAYAYPYRSSSNVCSGGFFFQQIIPGYPRVVSSQLIASAGCRSLSIPARFYLFLMINCRAIINFPANKIVFCWATAGSQHARNDAAAPNSILPASVVPAAGLPPRCCPCPWRINNVTTTAGHCGGSFSACPLMGN